MVSRRNYTQEKKEALVVEILGGVSVAKIAQREGIAAHTLYKWKEKIAAGDFTDSRRTEIELRKRIAELESAVSELAVENHIIKKTRKLMADDLKRERMLRNISPAHLVLSKVAERSASQRQPTTTAQKDAPTKAN